MGFALYLNELRRLPQKARDCDVDALILVRGAEDSGKLLSAVKGLMKSGLSVRVETEIPADIRFGALYFFDNGELKPERQEEQRC